MFICGAALIFLNFLQFIHAPEPTIVYKSSLKDEYDAANAFVKIKRNQVLPLVLHKEPILGKEILQTTRKALYRPVTILHAATIEGRMVIGTTFKKYLGDQLYFCPKQDEENACMAPQTFQNTEPLECAIEASPRMQIDQNQHSCGAGTSGSRYNVVYDICPNPQEYETTEINFYSVCYNLENKYTMYTSHIISSPSLLSTYLLYREHNIEYPITVNGEFKPSLLEKIEDETILEIDLKFHPENSAYKLQTLVPVADMAMALWRKTAYQNFNLNWQHVNLIPLWNKINEYVRKYAEEIFIDKIQIRVRTGVFNIISKPRNDGQMSNTWVKIISVVSARNSVRPEEVAILVNNFVRHVATASDDSTKSSNETEEPEENLCVNDSCTKSLKDEFRDVGGRVSCCSVTPEIRNLFGFESTSFENPRLLEIPGVNSARSSSVV